MSTLATSSPESTPIRPAVGPWIGAIVTLLALALGVFQLYTAGIRPLDLFTQRGTHLMLVLLVVFLLFPFDRRRTIVSWLIDGLFIAGVVYSIGYLLLNLDAVLDRTGFFTMQDIWAGTIGVVVLLEATRRILGLAFTMIGLGFIIYAMAGPRGHLPWLGELLPEVLAHRGYPIERIVGTLFLGQEGIFGVPLGVAATVVFTFVLFGAFLEMSGAGRFFINLAYAATGQQRGGPAKAAVVASGFMGSISGSAIANVATSGAFTIPLMKKLGYKPEEAGGVEAAASTGGMIMPPIMGAGVFLMAEFTGIPYAEIMMVSILPAILYFAIIYLFVDFIAAKQGLRGLKASELPKLSEVLRDGWVYLVPLGILIYFLLQGISPNRVGFVAIVAVLAITVLRWGVRRFALRMYDTEPLPIGTALVLGGRQFVGAFEAAARNAMMVTVACAMAGVVVGILGLTGLGIKFSTLMLSFSGGHLLLALLLVLLASLILGLGLPVTASYIVLAVTAAPALHHEFGLPLLIAHLVIYWYSLDSNVTPPVALAAFAGAAIAGANPMSTAIKAFKYAKGLYLIPLFMVYNPEIILGGPPLVVAWTVLTAIAALPAFAASLDGFMFTRVHIVLRVVLAVGTVCIFWPSFTVELIGLLLIVLVLAINLFQWRRERYGERQRADV